MCSRSMIISKVALQDATQMIFAEHNHIIETFAPDRADEPLHIWTLPWAVWCSDHFLNLHPVYPPTELLAVYLVAIPQEKAWRGLFRKCLDELLGGPSSRRMLSDVEVNNAPAIVCQYHQHEEYAKCGGRNGEKVDRHYLFDMVINEGAPGLRRRLLAFGHQTRDGSFRNFDSKLEQFAVDPRGAPQ